MVCERVKFKERMIHFIERASQRLKLSYQPTLHAIQLLGVLLSKHYPSLKEPVRDWMQGRCLGIALLSLCYRFYCEKGRHMRDWVSQVRQEGHCEWDGVQIGACIREWQMQIMKLLKWKLAIPLLYDEAMIAGHRWKEYHSQKSSDFPLSLNKVQNHNHLVNQVKICLYNYDLLIQHNSLESLSRKTKKLSLAIFSITIKQLIRKNFNTHYQVMSSRFSGNHMLEDYLKVQYQMIPELISHEINEVTHLLTTHTQSRSTSKPKKEQRSHKGQKEHNKDSHPKKTALTSYRHSQDKQNYAYYVKRKRMQSQNHDDHSEKHKSKSKSQPHKNNKSHKKSTLVKGKKKGSSTKSILFGAGSSILAKTSSVIKPAKDERRNRLGVKVVEPAGHSKKNLKYNISRASKRSDKSHHGSKIASQTIEDFTSKSNYWNRALPGSKTDKKSTTSSVRMKLR